MQLSRKKTQGSETQARRCSIAPADDACVEYVKETLNETLTNLNGNVISFMLR
jgi:hypothetical protein